MSDPSAAADPNKRRTKTLLTGMVAASVISAALYLGIGALVSAYHVPGRDWLTVPSLFLVPFVAGLTAALCWRRLGLRIGQCVLHSLSTTLIGAAGAAVFLGEGAVCLLIAFPALYVMILAGVLAGRIWFKPDFTKLQVSIFPLLALLIAGETFSRQDEQAVVTDQILIHAPPAKVWPHVLAFPEIPDRPSYWILRFDLPYPTATTNGGNFVGAGRQCIFSDGIVIKEKVAELVPNRKLTFEIVEQPTHPEAYGHLTLHRGQFVLHDNGDGTTTLSGSSWYTLHVRPLWYFDLWTRDMTRAVHLRVMQHVRRLAEH